MMLIDLAAVSLMLEVGYAGSCKVPVLPGWILQYPSHWRALVCWRDATLAFAALLDLQSAFEVAKCVWIKAGRLHSILRLFWNCHVAFFRACLWAPCIYEQWLILFTKNCIKWMIAMQEPKSIKWLFPPDIWGPEKTKISGQLPPQQPFLKVSHDINIPPFFTWTILGWFHLCKAKFNLSSMAATVASMRCNKCMRHTPCPCSTSDWCVPRPLAATNRSALYGLRVWRGLSAKWIQMTVRDVFRSSDVLQIIGSVITFVIVFMIYINVLLGRWWSQKCKCNKSMNKLYPWTHWCNPITLFDLVSCGYSAICKTQSAEWADHPARDCSACSGIKHLPPYFSFHLFFLSRFCPTKFKASDWYVLVTALAHRSLGNLCMLCGGYYWGASLPWLRPNCSPHYW